jgi:hypothetical protein
MDSSHDLTMALLIGLLCLWGGPLNGFVRMGWARARWKRRSEAEPAAIVVGRRLHGRKVETDVSPYPVDLAGISLASHLGGRAEFPRMVRVTPGLMFQDS